MSVSRPTTPLRRVSRGSISALSQSRGTSSTPLSFLEGALGNLADETSILSSNLEDLASIHDALNTFNEGFGMFLYGLKVAAYCIEWSEAPQEDSFARAQERKAREKSAPRYSTGSRIPQYTHGRPSTPSSGLYRGQAASTAADQTYMTVDDDMSFAAARRPGAGALGGGVKKPLKSALKQPSSSSHTRSSSGTTTTTGGRTGAVGKPGGVRSVSSSTSSSAGGANAAGSRQARTTTGTGTQQQRLTGTAGGAGPSSSSGVEKPKITLAQKKRREKYAEEVIETLPLEYRGSDPTANRLARSVIMALIAAAAAPLGSSTTTTTTTTTGSSSSQAAGGGARIAEIIKSSPGPGGGPGSDLPQAKVNKCLIALIAAKQVVKSSNNGIVYSLDPAKHPQLPP
ncbi:unnamed protein product [Parajaminaea phylloscopi]